MTQFIQVHFLTSYPPSNLNRDELGSPKTAIMGGVTRLRISSQSLKRAWRTSELFQSSLSNHLGKRTKRMGREIYKQFIDAGIAEKQAREWARTIAGAFGKVKEKKGAKKKAETQNVTMQENEVDSEADRLKDLDIEQLAHFSPEEQQAIKDLVNTCIAQKCAPNKEDLDLLRKPASAVDIACFGRMLADKPSYAMDAAIQVAHAVTTHAVDVEEDYFSAVDDLNDGTEDAGAGHLGETEFAAGLFYGYICINRDLLKDNLDGNEDLTQKTIAALLESAAKVSPTGKQNSFASRAYTSYMLVEKGPQQPRTLAVAFLDPVREEDLLEASIRSFEFHRENMDKVYGACAESFVKFNTKNAEGTLADVIAFAKAG